MERIFNFSAGPAILDEQVLGRIKESIWNYKSSGLGVMELSHRSKLFDEILQETKALLKELLSIPDNYRILFATGGATNQFSMVPMNLLGQGTVADFISTGVWSKKAIKEAKKFGKVRVIASSESDGFRSIPAVIDGVEGDSAYLHFTSNNTIYGTQFQTEPAGNNLVCDASSDILSRPLEIKRYGLIYAGAQKNLGTAGVTIVILREDLLERSKTLELPALLNYNTLAESDSLHNTPPTFPIYVVLEVLHWIRQTGGPAAIEQRNARKAALLYNVLDQSEFYEGYARAQDRSMMNVVFRLKDESLTSAFAEGALQQRLSGLPGHRSVGGFRASIYNAFPEEGVQALVEFMKEFERTRG